MLLLIDLEGLFIPTFGPNRTRHNSKKTCHEVQIHKNRNTTLSHSLDRSGHSGTKCYLKVGDVDWESNMPRMWWKSRDSGAYK